MQMTPRTKPLAIGILFALGFGPGFAGPAAAQLDAGSLATVAPSQLALPMIAGADSSYAVGPGDLLNISVYRSPDLTSQMRVAGDGTIIFPGVGSVQVGQMTAADIARRLARELKTKGILIDPQVNVLVSEVRAHVVQVIGQVGRPGQIPIDSDGLSLVAVLARAGANFSNGSSVVNVVGKDGRHESFLIADLTAGGKDRPARGGDILVVQAPATVYVAGQVGHAGGYPIDVGMTVGQALALGGGISATGSSGRITLTRKTPDGQAQVYRHVDQAMAVMPNDLITVQQRVF